MLKVLDISGYDEIAIIGNRTGNLQVVLKIFSGETDGFINTACIHWENLKGTYSGRYPFSIPVIPVHFFVSKDRYLLRS